MQLNLRHRKRYGPVATPGCQISECRVLLRRVSIPQAVWPSCNKTIDGVWNKLPKSFQYRKRYGPVATEFKPEQCFKFMSVSIPQAVWPSCNEEMFRMCSIFMPQWKFQYRKRYGPVATASLESRFRTGLKWQIGKPPRFFPLLPAVSVNTSSFFVTFIRFSTSIYAGFRVHEKIGKPLFQLSYIIAGFC